MNDELKFLFGQVEEIIESSQNLANKSLWESRIAWPRDMWRGFPKLKPSQGKIPFLVFPDNALWAKILKVDLREYYSHPEVHLKTQLRMNIYHFNYWKDNTYYTRDLFIWFGVVTELSFFGPKIVLFPNREGWIESPPLLAKKRDLGLLQRPDFYKSGLMPKVHEFYERMSELVGGRFRVLFPMWVRGPFCIAAHLRGLENIIMDMLEDSKFVHKLMRFITDSEKEWAKKRAKFLHSPIGKSFLFNDEVGLPLITPKMYEEFVLPYEIELSNFYGGILYWHSCGDTSNFVSLIRKIPGLKMFHIGPRTDISKVAVAFGADVSLDVDLDPLRDILEADEEKMNLRIRKIIDICRERDIPFCIRADGFQPVHTLEEDLPRIKLWINIAQSLTKETHIIS
jgi:uroporphyrinogen-III decarboxylase